jgi:hypothetical protein
MEILLPDDGVKAVATLLENEAPKTCKAVWDALPIKGELLHAMLSGNEVFILLEGKAMIKVEPENQIYHVIPGDVAYFYSHWGDAKYLKDNPEFAEIVVIYGRYTRLQDLSGRLAAANLFATITEGLEGFAEICKKVRREGAKKIILRKLKE